MRIRNLDLFVFLLVWLSYLVPVAVIFNSSTDGMLSIGYAIWLMLLSLFFVWNFTTVYQIIIKHNAMDDVANNE